MKSNLEWLQTVFPSGRISVVAAENLISKARDVEEVFLLSRMISGKTWSELDSEELVFPAEQLLLLDVDLFSQIFPAYIYAVEAGKLPKEKVAQVLDLIYYSSYGIGSGETVNAEEGSWWASLSIRQKLVVFRTCMRIDSADRGSVVNKMMGVILTGLDIEKDESFGVSAVCH
jgi:hypothetical protein